MPLKTDIRKAALHARKSLSQADFEALNAKIVTHFKSLDLSSIKVLQLFLPIIQQKEPNTFLIIDELKQQYPEIEILIPRANFEDFTMQNFIYHPDKLLQNAYGIPEPNPQATAYTGAVDILLVPLLAFDSQGYRVGYGKGFYDRYIQSLSKKPRLIGLSLSATAVEISDIHSLDEKLDACITPEGIIWF